MGSKISKRSADYFVISHGLERECQCCHNTEWMGEKIMLEIHHIDGDKTNNDDSNIMILCPNCHSLTDNYKAKNRKKVVLRMHSSCLQLSFKVKPGDSEIQSPV